MANRKDGEVVGVGGEHYTENMQFLQNVIASYTSLHDTVLHVVKSALHSDFAPQYLLMSIPATWISYFVISQVGWSWAWCWMGLWVLGAGRALPNGNKVDAGLGITGAVDLSALTNQLTRTIDIDMRWFDNISTFLAALPTAVQRIHGGPSVPSTSERRDSGHDDGDAEPETLFISMMENQRWWAGPGWIPHLLPEERSAFTTASPPYTPLPAPFPPTVAPTLPPAVALALPPMSNASSLAVTDPALIDTAIFHAFKLDPARYVFSSDWKVDMSWTSTDSQGWVYTDHQWMNPTAKASLCSLTRRRRWMRSLRSLKRDLPFAAEARTQ
ncbi:hypothetical protein HDU85_005753 [Gaertneriomyces sp. JEL0708]|nr:hypothetical protein HDU85_005753 [Gaertneriomyces sp. JEL0708]